MEAKCRSDGGCDANVYRWLGEGSRKTSEPDIQPTRSESRESAIDVSMEGQLSESEREDINKAQLYHKAYPVLVARKTALMAQITNQWNMPAQREFNEVASHLELIEMQWPQLAPRLVSLQQRRYHYEQIMAELDFIQGVAGERVLTQNAFLALVEACRIHAGDNLAYWVNSAVFSIRFGDLVHHFADSSRNSLEKSLNIVHKKLREGRFQPMEWADFSAQLQACSFIPKRDIDSTLSNHV